MTFVDLREYSQADIQSLIDNNVEESIHLDFKDSRALEKSDKKKEDISKDVSAFANSDGGIIVYGISERNHCAGSLSFVDGGTFTKEWLEQVINSKVFERVEGVQIFPVRFDGDLKKTVYVVKIPRSTRAPHMCSDHKYYRRYGTTSVPMEEYEVRDLFYRVNKAILDIEGIYLYKNDSVNRDECEYEVRSSIVNKGTVPETIYKLNYYLTAPGGLHLDKISWDPQKDTNNYSRWEDGLKISAISTAPLFPEERIDFGRFTIELTEDQAKEFIKNTSVRLVLFFQGGSVEKSYELSQFCDQLISARPMR